MLYPGSEKPLFIQLKNTILRKLAQGEYKEGDQLPSERELSERYDISRVTVRQALNELAQDGIIVKKQGKGNFVAIRRIDHRLDSLLGFVEELAIKDMKCEVSVLKKEYIVAPAEVCEAMQSPENTVMLLIMRHIYLDGQPLGIDYTYLNKDIAYLVENLNFHEIILYQYLEKSGYKLDTADQVIIAENPSEEEAKLLEIEDNKPLLSLSRVAYTEGRLPLVYSKTIYRSDRYRYTLTLKRYPTIMNST